MKLIFLRTVDIRSSCVSMKSELNKEMKMAAYIINTDNGRVERVMSSANRSNITELGKAALRGEVTQA